MTIIKMTKYEIVKALREEPTENLRIGNWLGVMDRSDPIAQTKNCAVCAVGAVMRRALDGGQPCWALFDAIAMALMIENGGKDFRACDIQPHPDTDGELFAYARELVTDGKYVTALSCVFEGLHSLEMDRRTRKRDEYISDVVESVVTFVKDHFPDTITIDIDGARPAKDVEVVAP